MTKRYLGEFKLSTIARKSALFLLLFTIFGFSSIGFAQSCKITKFVKAYEDSDDAQYVHACITDYRVTTRFGYAQQNPARNNLYDIELFALDVNNQSKRIAIFNFINPEPVRKVEYNQNQDYYDIYVPAQNRLSVIDLLRNESEIYLVIEKHAGDLWSGWLMTP